MASSTVVTAGIIREWKGYSKEVSKLSPSMRNITEKEKLVRSAASAAKRLKDEYDKQNSEKLRAASDERNRLRSMMRYRDTIKPVKDAAKKEAFEKKVAAVIARAPIVKCKFLPPSVPHRGLDYHIWEIW